MKYLFSVDNLQKDTKQLYLVEATTQNLAEIYFTKKFLPYVNEISFEELADCLSNMDINIDIICNLEEIKEL